MRDYSKYEKTPVLFSGAEKKFEIIIDGFRYIVKFQKNSEVGLTFNYVSEYLGSHIFQLLGIPVQETFLGTYEGKNVVVMKNFLEPEDALVAFNGVGESSLERDKELYQYTYEDITAMLRENMKSTNVEETIDRFWDMFIVDALIGNFDRHGGNWGFIKKDNQYRIAPVYDNGSSLYYAKAVAWAVENGITTGTGDGKFSPDATCTRAQSVTFLFRAIGKLVDSKAEFSDVLTNSYYANAVAWAVENGVTNGIGDGLFGPDNSCTRAQIVTFLFRAYQGK